MLLAETVVVLMRGGVGDLGIWVGRLGTRTDRCAYDERLPAAISLVGSLAVILFSREAAKGHGHMKRLKEDEEEGSSATLLLDKDRYLT